MIRRNEMNRFQVAVALSEINNYDAAKREEICTLAVDLLTAAPAPSAPDLSTLPRFAIFELKDGVYEHPLGSYVLFRDIEKLLAAPAPSAPSDDGMYFLQDKRSYVGNCVVWWAKDNKGYTTQIEQAHRYTKEQAFAQHKGRASDIPWPCSVVLPHAKPTIDMQDLHKTDYARTVPTMGNRF
jgi:hypothetical protein